MNAFKVGDIVRTTDYSYTMRVWPNGELNTKTTHPARHLDEPLEVLAIGLSLPGENSDGNPRVNDTIVKREADGAVLFIQERFLRLISRPKRTVKKTMGIRPFTCGEDAVALDYDPKDALPEHKCCGPVQTITVEIYK